MLRIENLRRLIAQVLIVALLASCAATNLPPISAAGAAFRPAPDEVRLWQSAREEERKLLDQAPLYDDPLLEDYLLSIVNRLNPPTMAANPAIAYRVHVIKEPTLNAFAYPHGSIYVHTGLLAQMDNEDELATVLGHEMTHVERRHMLRLQRTARNRQLALFAAAVAGAVWVASAEGHAAKKGHYGKAARIRVLSDLMLGLGLQLAFIASVNGYGRNLEREADEGGFQKMQAAGYDTAQAERVYQKLADETSRPSKLETFFFGNHPRIEERIASAKEWVSAHPETARPARRRPETEFNRRLRAVIRDDAELNLELGRLDRAGEELERALAMLPGDPRTHYLVGKLELARAEKAKGEEQADLKAKAQEAFQEAVRLDPQAPEPHRELGLLAYRSGDLDFACKQLQTYVRLDPNGEQIRVVKDYILELRQDGHCRR